MNLLEAQKVVMPFGAHKGDTLIEIAREEPSYLTDFLAERIDTLDAWLREALVLVLENMPSTRGENAAQGELFGDQQT